VRTESGDKSPHSKGIACRLQLENPIGLLKCRQMKAILFLVMGAAICADGCADRRADGQANGPADAASLSCPGQTWYTYPPGGLQYASTISKERLAASSDWEEEDPNPPLPARRALALAEATVRRTLKDSDGKNLERLCDSARLVPFGGKKWCWNVHYKWRPRAGAWDGVLPHFEVFILMDGTVVEPVGRRWGGPGQ
jgi:hypothetical protein